MAAEQKSILDNLSEAVITFTDSELQFNNKVGSELLDKVRTFAECDDAFESKVFQVPNEPLK